VPLDQTTPLRDTRPQSHGCFASSLAADAMVQDAIETHMNATTLMDVMAQPFCDFQP
jgi:hypothetical protein